MFLAPLSPSSGAREYYKATAACDIWCFGFQVVGTVWSWRLCVRFAGTPYRQLENQAPNTTGSNHLYNTLELLMMSIVVPETCWASSKICNKNHLLHLVGILFPHINDDARSQSHLIYSHLFIFSVLAVFISLSHLCRLNGRPVSSLRNLIAHTVHKIEVSSYASPYYNCETST